MIRNNELTFVGHSLGGGEAAAASMATGKAAITFNPAAVSNRTKKKHGLGSGHNITNYITIGPQIGNTNIRIGGDPFTNLQNNIGLKADGINNYISISLTDPVTSHRIKTIIKELLQQ